MFNTILYKHASLMIATALISCITFNIPLHAMHRQYNAKKTSRAHSSHRSPQEQNTKKAYTRPRPQKPNIAIVPANPKEIPCQLCAFWNHPEVTVCAMCNNKLAFVILPNPRSLYEEKDCELTRAKHYTSRKDPLANADSEALLSTLLVQLYSQKPAQSSSNAHSLRSRSAASTYYDDVPH